MRVPSQEAFSFDVADQLLRDVHSIGDMPGVLWMVAAALVMSWSC